MDTQSQDLTEKEGQISQLTTDKSTLTDEVAGLNQDVTEKQEAIDQLNVDN